MKKERLDNLLVRLGLFPSRNKAVSEIMAGNVLVNETPALKAGQMVSADALIRIKKKFPYVSRGALKLIHALDTFQIDVKDKIAIDIGASTGGFTEILLEKGASLVYAVDCGTNQLDWKLRSNPRVISMEKINARYIDKYEFNPKPQIATIDVSFISITKILLPLIHILEKNFKIITLIKPQFELEKTKVGKKGLVAEEFRQEATQKVLDYASSIGLTHEKVIESPITGAKSGNVEFMTVFY